MRLTISCTVKDENKEEQVISIFTGDIEQLILQKAEEKGIKGYEGRAWRHLDEKIVSVCVED
jgi:hypothetical protein